MPSRNPPPPTLDQLYVLIARAERKGGLNHLEGARLREGLRLLGEQQPAEIAELRRKLTSARNASYRWKQIAASRSSGRRSPSKTPGSADDPRAALLRVTALARRWTHIPAKRQAGMAVLAAIDNKDSHD